MKYIKFFILGIIKLILFFIVMVGFGCLMIPVLVIDLGGNTDIFSNWWGWCDAIGERINNFGCDDEKDKEKKNNTKDADGSLI